jgi:hypothetical protein
MRADYTIHSQPGTFSSIAERTDEAQRVLTHEYGSPVMYMSTNMAGARLLETTKVYLLLCP